MTKPSFAVSTEHFKPVLEEATVTPWLLRVYYLSRAQNNEQDEACKANGNDRMSQANRQKYGLRHQQTQAP